MGDLTAEQKRDIERVTEALGRSELLRERLRVLDEALAEQQVSEIGPEGEPECAAGPPTQPASPPRRRLRVLARRRRRV